VPEGLEIGEKVRYDFSSCVVEGQELNESQRQFLIANYLVEFRGTEAYVNTLSLQEDLAVEGSDQPRRKSIDEE